MLFKNHLGSLWWMRPTGRSQSDKGIWITSSFWECLWWRSWSGIGNEVRMPTG